MVSKRFPAVLNAENKKSIRWDRLPHALLPVLEKDDGLLLPGQHRLVEVETGSRTPPASLHLEEGEGGAQDQVQPGLRPLLPM